MAEYRFIAPKLDAGSDDARAVRQHAAEIARSLRGIFDLVNDLNSRVATLEPATALGLFLAESGSGHFLLEDGSGSIATE